MGIIRTYSDTVRTVSTGWTLNDFIDVQAFSFESGKWHTVNRFSQASDRASTEAGAFARRHADNLAIARAVSTY